MYNGTDRVQQVNTLNDIAQDLFEGYQVQSPTDATLAVQRWEESLCNTPDWYNDHDRVYLMLEIATEALRTMLYQKHTGTVLNIELTDGDYGPAVTVVVLTPEEEVAYRLETYSTNAPWESGTVEDAAGYITYQQKCVMERE